MAAGGKEMEIAIRIAGKVESSFKNALGAATKGIGGITKAVSAATTAAAAAVGAIGVASVNVGMEFENSMASLAATADIDIGSEKYKELETAAREMGKSTSKTAAESADALQYMALAGWSVEDSIKGLPSILHLSEASGMELAQTSDMVTDTMSALGVSIDELPDYLDVVTKAQNTTNQSAEDLMEAYLGVGGTLKSMGISTRESATALGVLANRGTKGSEAGNALNAIMVNLTTGAGQAGKMMKSLGISAFDSEGNFIGLRETLETLNEATKGLTQEEQNAAFAAIGGKTHVEDLQKLMAGLNDTTADGTQEWEAIASGLNDADGALENMRNRKKDNLTGDIESLQSAVSNLGIGIYQGLNGPLREAAKSATAMAGELSDAFDSGGMEGMAGAVGNCLSQAVDAVTAYAPQVVGMGVNMLQSFIGGIVQNAGSMANAASGILSVFVNGLFTMVPQVIFAGISMMLQFVQSITGQIPQLISGGIQAIAGFAQGIMACLPEVTGTAVQLIGSLTQGIQDNLPGLIPAAMNALVSFSGSLRENAGKLVDAGLKMIMTLASSLIDNIPVFIETIPTIITNIAGIINDNAPKLLSSGLQLVIKLVVGIIKAIPTIVMNIPKIIQAIVAVITAFNWLSLGTKIITALGSGIKTAITSIPQIFRNFVQNARNTVSSFGWSSLGRGIVMTIGNGIRSLFTMIPQLLKNIGSFAINAIKNIDWWNVGITIIQFICQAISGAGGMLWDAIKGIGGGIVDGFKSLFGGGDDEAGEEGEKAAESYAEGVKTASEAAGQTSFFDSLFGGEESSQAAAAGAETGAAFLEGMSGGMESATADTSGILGSETLGDEMSAAGAAGAGAYMTGFNEELSGETLDASAWNFEAVPLEEMAEAGAQGAEAVSSGMTDNSMAITTAADTLGTEVNVSLDNSWQQVNTRAQSAMQKLVETVTTAANAVKAAFENMTITVPKPKLPVISVSNTPVPYGEGGSVSVPQFSVSWNALGGIFDKPTIFNTSAGMQGVGEAGPEAILPLDALWTQMREIVGQTVRENNGVSIVDALAEKLRGIGSGNTGGNAPQLAGSGGPNVTYSPVYNLYGSASKEDVMEADSMSQAQFNKMMKQYLKDKSRRDL